VSDRLTILMTCGAGPGVVGHIDAARGNGYAPVRIVVGDVSADENAGFALADDRVLLPSASDPQLVDELLAICGRYDVDVLWPVFDGELEPLSASRERFEAEGVRLLLADDATVRLCLDKAAFFQRLADTGLVPPSRVARSSDELRSAAEAFGYPDRRVAVKPIRGTGGRGFHVIDAGHDDRERFFDARPDVTSCTLDAAADALARREGRDDGAAGVLVMPFVEGEEYGCDALADDGQIVAAVTRHKRPPFRDGMHTRIVVDEDPVVIGVVQRVLDAIGATGLLSVDLREDDDGDLRVLEINPRAGAYLGMACARIDLFGLALGRLFGQLTDVDAMRRSSEPIVALRYWADMVHLDGRPRVLGGAAACERVVSQTSDCAGGCWT